METIKNLESAQLALIQLEHKEKVFYICLQAGLLAIAALSTYLIVMS